MMVMMCPQEKEFRTSLVFFPQVFVGGLLCWLIIKFYHSLFSWVAPLGVATAVTQPVNEVWGTAAKEKGHCRYYCSCPVELRGLCPLAGMLWELRLPRFVNGICRPWVFWLEVCGPDWRLVISARLALARLGLVSVSICCFGPVWDSPPTGAEKGVIVFSFSDVT